MDKLLTDMVMDKYARKTRRCRSIFNKLSVPKPIDIIDDVKRAFEPDGARSKGERLLYMRDVGTCENDDDFEKCSLEFREFLNELGYENNYVVFRIVLAPRIEWTPRRVILRGDVNPSD